MKSNMITKMITMCMCMMVVGFAKQNVHEPINLEQNTVVVAEKPNPDQEKIDYYNALEGQHGESSITDWSDENYMSNLSAEKAAAWGSNVYVPAGRDADHTFEVCIDSWASEGSWAVYSYAAGGYITDTQYFSAGYECNSLTLNLAPGTYDVDSWDSYGDGGQSIYVDGAYVGSSSGSYSYITVELSDPAGCDANAITLVVGGGSWGSEVSWDLSDGSSGGTGTFDLCLDDGDYTFNGYDSYGDGWNGNTATFSDADGSVIASYAVEGSSGSWTLTIGGAPPVAGCTDPDAPNYDSGAEVDDGSCEAYCSDSQFDCGDGQCIPASYYCDGSSEFCNAGWGADCSNGADEGLETCGYADECAPGVCEDCVYDFTPYGAECCDAAADAFGLSCAALEGDYFWDCEGCSCPLDEDGWDDLTCAEQGALDDCADDDCCPTSWVGDGYADGSDQPYGCDLTCYECDGGDVASDCAGTCEGTATDDSFGICGGDGTLQGAIDAAADGATINIPAGTYVENIVIDAECKSITLDGGDASSAIIDGGGGQVFKIGYTSSSCAGKDIILKNVTVQNGTYGLRSKSGNVSVLNSVFVHNGWDGTGMPDTDVDPQSDFVTFFASLPQGGAMRIQNSTGSEIANNLVYENDRGIRLENGVNGNIHDNVAHNNIQAGIYLAASSYTGATGCSNTTVSNNESYGNGNNGLLSIGGIGNTFSGNNVHGNWNSGMMMWHVSDNVVDNNTFDGNNIYSFNAQGNNGDAYGAVTSKGGNVDAAASFNFILEGNTISNNGNGNQDTAIGVFVEDGLLSTTISDNVFTGQDPDISYGDSTTASGNTCSAGCDCNSGSVADECGICDGDNSSCADCAGVPNGDATEDNCGTCDNDPSNDCADDCAGVPGGDADYDCSGTCVAGWLFGYLGDGWCDGSDAPWGIDLSCYDCDNGDCSGDCGCEDDSSCLDDCGVPNGDGSSCADCAGTPNGDAELDYCGVCEGGNVEDDCHADDGCLTVSMTDAYGDGWNGNVLIIGDESFTIESGASAEGTYCGPSDVVVTCGGGSWMSEVSWSISDGSGELLSGGAPFDGCLGTCDDAPEECVNDDSGADSYGDTCSSWYDANESPGSYGCSGGYDDDDFNAATMCCACQGAESPGDDDVVDSPHAGDKLAEAKLNYIEQQNRLDNPIATPDVSRDDCGGTGPDVGCDGVCFSGLEIDECGDCDGGGLNGDGCCYDLAADCAGTCGGDSFTDCIGQCASAGYAGWIGDGYCDDGTWGLYFDCDEFNCDAGDCLDDCGDCSGGNAAMDDCGVCDGDNSDCADCAGTPYGDAVDDCSGDGDCFSAAWVGDGYCDGADQAWGADLTCYDCDGGDCIDECGVCDGSGIADGNCDCDGNTDDCCGDCGGDNSGCGGSGDVNGGGIDVTDIVLMVGDILETDALDACEAYEADITGDGNVNVLDVIAAVEIILSGQTGGCTDEAADNYDADADYDDGSCSYAPPTCADQGLWDCGDGQCIPTSYVCDGSSEFCNAGWGPDCANGADEGLDACGYTDDCVAGACDDCEFDFTAYGSECCDTAWGEYGLDCNTLESDYNWDCSGCGCPGDAAAVCGDGNCSGDENNETCPDDCEPLSACETAGGNDSWLGDGWCDSINNNEACGFDTGDCCPTSCADSAANNCPDNPDGCYSTCADGACCGDCDDCADPDSSDAADCEAADDGGSDTCADCEYDWSAYGSECCDTAATEFGIDCATLTANYGWDCSGCNCPLDGGGDDGGSACEGNEAWIADGWCDGSNNNEGCGYDGGDCCPSTCVDAAYSCEQYGGDCADCIDPSAEDSNGGGSCADAPDPTCADTDCGYFMSVGYTCYELLGYGYDCSLCEAEGADCSEPEGCSASQWTCADGSCIPAAYYCDGSAENGNAGWGPDCGDGSDEVLEECCANGSYDDATCGTGGGGNCELTMNDAYGDGWNGNEWCSGGQCAGLTSGASGTASFDFDLSAANNYTCGGGSWQSEVSWSLSCDGSEVASGGAPDEGCFGAGCGRSDGEVSDSDLKMKMVATHGIIVPERNISLGLIGHVTDLNATKADRVKSMSMVTKSIVKHNAKKPVDVIPYEAPLNRKAAPKFESKLQRAESVKLIQTAEGLKYEADGFVGFEITLSHGADFEINVTESAFIADYKTTGNTTKVIVVGPETENLFSSTGDYTIVDVIAGTSGGAALSADIVSIPTVFGLNDAYPNPFNPTTSIELAMPQDGFVSVKVYNLMGQVVATLHEGNLTANSYTFTWDAADVASGMYFLKAETAGNVDIQKIMLMK